MNPVPNQPVGFNRVVDCNIDSGPDVLLAQRGDITQFQFEVTNCLGEPNLIYNGDFTRAGGNGQGWSIPIPSAWELRPYDGAIKHIPGQPQSCITQQITIADGVLFQLTYTVNQTQGQSSVTIGSYNVNHTGAVNGTFSEWVVASGGIGDIRICAKLLSDAMFSNISVIAYNTRHNARLVDTQTDLVAHEPIAYNIFNGWYTHSINWAALTLDHGCYRIEVASPCDCGQFGLIGLDLKTGEGSSAISQYSTGYWIKGNRWAINNGVATYVGVSVPDTNQIRYFNSPLCVGREYTVSYRVVGALDARVRVSLGNTLGTWRDTDGAYTEILTATTTGNFAFTAQSVGVAGLITIDNVVIEAVRKSYEFVSEPIKFIPEDCRTHNFAICNDSNALGMGFVGTGFVPNFRVLSHVRGTNYKSERNAYTNSRGRSSTYFGISRKVFEFGFGAPEFVHDFCRLAVIADHVFIDDDEYFFEADEYPSQSLNDTNDISGVALPLSKKVENIRNRRVSDLQSGCGNGGTFISVLPEGGGGVITGGRPSDGGRPLSTDGKPINWTG